MRLLSHGHSAPIAGFPDHPNLNAVDRLASLSNPITHDWKQRFARARVEMKAVETVIHLRREQPGKMKNMMPPHIWTLVQPYALTATAGEVPDATDIETSTVNPEQPQKI